MFSIRCKSDSYIHEWILLQQIICFQGIKLSIDVRGMEFIWHELSLKVNFFEIKHALNCYWNIFEVIKSIQEVACEGFYFVWKLILCNIFSFTRESPQYFQQGITAKAFYFVSNEIPASANINWTGKHNFKQF